MPDNNIYNKYSHKHSPTTLIGRRIWPNGMGYLVGLDMPGDFGRAILSVFICPYVLTFPKLNWWQVIAPDGSSCCLNPAIHTIEEQADGTITVTPSIVTRSWHGFLTKGVWTSV